MPPQVVGGTAGNMTVTIPPNGNNVLFSVLFIGPSSQTVTINGTLFSSATQNGLWSSTVVNQNGAQQQIIFAAQINNAAYPNVNSAPVAAGLNEIGFDATDYSNAGGQNKTVITVLDLGGIE